MNKEHHIYADYVEGKALDQFYSAMKMDFALKGALMPDTHAGYSLPIGGVVATEGVVIPAWVGFDIGCGMCAIQVPVEPEQVKQHAQSIYEEIYRTVPVGFAVNTKSAEHATELDINDLTEAGRKVALSERKPGRAWQYALGSLGGWNHFIEVGADEKSGVWVVIHSGSRGIGHGIATHYMKLAGGGRAREGHYPLRVDSDAGQEYINDMNWALQYALDNRKEMILRVEQAIMKFCEPAEEAFLTSMINRNHNHATQREVDGKEVWIHRKGATHAEEGMMGVIPGNMRDGSFIVKGKGNPDSLYSSSHGAGRVMGRKEAKRQLDVEEFKKIMSDADIVARTEEGTLDECPLAYKSIFEVMEQQKDLVEVVAHVRPILNIKG